MLNFGRRLCFGFAVLFLTTICSFNFLVALLLFHFGMVTSMVHAIHFGMVTSMVRAIHFAALRYVTLSRCGVQFISNLGGNGHLAR